MNNAFAIGATDNELACIITIGAGAAIIARNAPGEIPRFGVEQRSGAPAGLQERRRAREPPSPLRD